MELNPIAAPAARSRSVVLASIQTRSEVPEAARHGLWRGPRLDWVLGITGVLFALAFRWYGFHRPSLWIDEMSSFGLAQQTPDKIIPNIIVTDAHPPLYIFLVYIGHTLFHLGIAGSVRVPSIIAGALTVGVVYALARLLLNRGAALVAAALTLTSPFLFWYSREGRMYAASWLLVLTGFLALVMAVRTRRWPWFLFYALANAAALYADISAILAIVPQAALIGWFCLVNRGSIRRLWLRAGLAYATGWLLFVPWLVVLPQQLPRTHGTFSGYSVSASTVWRIILDLVGVQASYAFLLHFLAPGAVAGVLIIVTLGALLAVGWLGRQKPLFTATVLALTAGPVVVAGLIVAAGSPSVLLPRVLGLIVFGLILAISGAAALVWDAVGRRLAPGSALALALLLVLVGSAAGLRTVDVHGSKGQDWRPVAAIINAQAKPGDELIYYPYGIKYLVDGYIPIGWWYLHGTGMWVTTNAVAQSWFQVLAPGHPRVWLVFYNSAGIDPPAQDAWFTTHGYLRVAGNPAADYGVLEYEPINNS